MNLASASVGSIPLTTILISAIPILAVIRYVNVLLNDYVNSKNNEEKLMGKIIRQVVMFVSCFTETVWAGMISVVAGVMTGGVQGLLALAKFNLRTVMGCRGSEVQILSCRPKTH